MDKTLLALHDEGKTSELQKSLEELSNEELMSVIDNRAVRGRGDPVALIRAILSGSPAEKSCGLLRRMHIFKHCIGLLQGTDLSSKVASELVGLLMLETDAFPSRCLAELASQFVESIKNGVGTSGKSLELFPKVLSALAAQDTVSYDGKEMSGSDYKSHVLNSLCSGRWDTSSVIHLAAMFKDVPMSSDELRFVIDKILRLLHSLDLQELPPLIYQLLLLAAKGHKKFVLEGITSFFMDQDTLYKRKQASEQDSASMDLLEPHAPGDQLRHVEGTIILHVTFAIKQDQDLGREFIKYLKSCQQGELSVVLSPFNVALAMSIARIHRFEEQIYDLLKTSIVKSYKDADKQRDSGWVREMVPKETDLTAGVLDTVKNSVFGWDHVTQGLVQLGFTLMDAFGPRSAFGRVIEIPAPTLQSPTQKACSLGSNVLMETFKIHEMVRSEILEQILNRVLTKATSPVSHFIDLLSQTISSAPQILLDSLPKVREAFDYLSYLPPPTADGLLRAVQPLMKISMSLKDGLILVLRKSMFSKQLEARKIAVNGFLLILRNFRVLGGVPSSQASYSQSFSSSQIQVDVHVPYNAATNEALCLEVLGNLRRCLSQQAEVRLQLYEGLYDVLCKNSQLKTPMLQIMYSQLIQYYERQEDVQPPIKLDACILAQGDNVYLGEPLAHLLSCIVQCLLKASQTDGDQSDDEDHEDSQSDLEEMLESLTRRMIKSELEDFELDKSADFSMGNSVGVKNNIFAILVLGTYETLMEFVFFTSDFEVASIQKVIHLYQNYQKLSDIIRSGGGAKGGGGGGKRGRPTAGTSGASGAPSGGAKSVPKSLLSVRMAASLLKALYNDDIPGHQESVGLLRQSLDVQRYVVGVVIQKLSQINDRGTCDGAEGNNKEKLFKYVCNMAKVLLKHYNEDLNAPDDMKRDRSKQLALQCLDGFSTAVNIVCTRYISRLQDFLHSIDGSRVSGAGMDKSVDDQDRIHMHIKRIQRLVLTIVTSQDDDCSQREAVPLVSVIGVLSKHLNPDGQQFTQLQTWAQRVCTEQNIDDTAVVKAMLSLLISLTIKQKSVLPVIRNIAQDIHGQLGDIDQEVEIEEEAHFKVVTQRSATITVMQLILGHVEREMDDTDWMIHRLKAQGQGNSGASQVDVTQKEGQEKSVCTRLGHTVNTLHELVQTALPVGAAIDTLLKVITRVYATLTLITKYYLGLFSQKTGQLSTRFEKLIKLTGVNLTHYVYAMITYIQASQSEHLQQVAEKSKKKDRKISTSIAMAGKAQVLKEAKSIPNLIFAIEQFEKFLIQLSKKSKINLMEHMKTSTSRDFRIEVTKLREALREQQSSESEPEEEEEEATNAPQPDGSSEDSEDEQENIAPSGNKRPSSPVSPLPPQKKAKLGAVSSTKTKSKNKR